MEFDLTSYPAPKDGFVPPDAATTISGLPAMRWGIIAELAKLHGWVRGAEVGCADARTTDRVLKACRNLHMLAIDLWAPQDGSDGPEDWMNWPHAEHEAAARAVARRHGARCTIIKGLSVDIAGSVEDASLDFVFLDGDHSEAGVRADLSAWAPKIRRGGMILGHDINWPSVRAAVDDLMPGYWIAGNNVWGREV